MDAKTIFPCYLLCFFSCCIFLFLNFSSLPLSNQKRILSYEIGLEKSVTSTSRVTTVPRSSRVVKSTFMQLIINHFLHQTSLTQIVLPNTNIYFISDRRPHNKMVTFFFFLRYLTKKPVSDENAISFLNNNFAVK